MKKKNCFTIAEIVITMMILGGIAMILMPTLLNNTQDKIGEVALNKTYSMFQQNARSIGLLISQGKIVESVDPVDTFFDALSLMNKSKQGAAGGNSQMDAYLADYTPEYARGEVGTCLISNFLSTNSNTLILNNGVFVMAQDADCNVFDENGSPTKQNNGGKYIIVDTNGVRLPNKVGTDIFFFTVSIDNGMYKVSPAMGRPGGTACDRSSSSWYDRIGCGRETLGMN